MCVELELRNLARNASKMYKMMSKLPCSASGNSISLLCSGAVDARAMSFEGPEVSTTVSFPLRWSEGDRQEARAGEPNGAPESMPAMVGARGRVNVSKLGWGHGFMVNNASGSLRLCAPPTHTHQPQRQILTPRGTGTAWKSLQSSRRARWPEDMNRHHIGLQSPISIR